MKKNNLELSMRWRIVIRVKRISGEEKAIIFKLLQLKNIKKNTLKRKKLKELRFFENFDTTNLETLLHI
jgi:hypothetical protein